MKKLRLVILTLAAVNIMFGQNSNPNSNRKRNNNDYSNFFEYERNTQKKKWMILTSIILKKKFRM